MKFKPKDHTKLLEFVSECLDANPTNYEPYLESTNPEIKDTNADSTESDKKSEIVEISRNNAQEWLNKKEFTLI